MDVVPVARGDDGHLVDGKELLDIVEGAGGAGAARGRHGGGRLVGHRAPRAHKEAVHEAEKRSRGVRVVHRAAEDEAVGLGGLGRELVDRVVVDAAAELGAAAAGHAAAHGPAPDPEYLGVDAVLHQRGRDLLERAVDAAVLVRAAVDEQYLHAMFLSLAGGSPEPSARTNSCRAPGPDSPKARSPCEGPAPATTPPSAHGPDAPTSSAARSRPPSPRAGPPTARSPSRPWCGRSSRWGRSCRCPARPR